MTTNEELCDTIYLGEQMKKNQSEIKITDHCSTIDQLKEYLIDRKESSIIVIISEENSDDLNLLKTFPQICAIYDVNSSCLYCLPEMASAVDRSIQKNHKRCSMFFIEFLEKYWFLIGLLVVIGFAYLFPDIGKTGGYIRAEWSIKLGCVILIFFLSGLSLRIEQLGKELTRIRLHLFVQTFSLLIIPFCIYAFVLLLMKVSFSKTLCVGILIMGSTSTTISSNVVMTKNAMGNEYAALLNAILGNILGIFVSPALILYFMKNPIFSRFSTETETKTQMEYGKIILNLCITILLPLFVGQIIHFIWTEKVLYLKEKLHFAELSSLALLAVVWSVFSSSFATRSFQLIHQNELFLLILIDIGIYLVFSLCILIIARLPIKYWQYSKKDTVAMAFCSAAKSLAMGFQLINILYGKTNEKVIGVLSLPLILYHASHLIVGAFEVILLKKWIQRPSKSIKTDNAIPEEFQMIDRTVK